MDTLATKMCRGKGLVGNMIKFYINPKNWFLDADEKKLKIIDMTLTGETRERAITDLIEVDIDKKREHLLLDKKYDKIMPYEYEIKDASLSISEGELLERAILKIDLKYEKITQQQYEHKIADLNNEPYVNVTKLNFDEKNPSQGYFELDFNEYFVEYLAQNGYEGIEPEEIVNTWFDDLCKSIVYESLTDNEGVAKSYLTDSTEGQLVQRFPVGKNFSEYQ